MEGELRSTLSGSECQPPDAGVRLFMGLQSADCFWGKRRAACPGRPGWFLRVRLVAAAVFVALAVQGSTAAQVPGSAEIDARVDSHLKAAKRAESIQDYLAAAEEYKAILELRPGWALIHQSLGVTYHLAKRFPQAIDHLRQAVRLDDQLWGTFLFLGMDYYQTHQFELAVSALEKSLALNPQMVETRRWLGLSHAALQRYEDAIGHLAQVAASNASEAEALFHLARIYDSRASQLFQSIGDRDPESPFVYLLQAERLSAEDDLPRAKAEYRRALALRPDLAGTLDGLEPTQANPSRPDARQPGPFAAARSSFAAGRYQEVSVEAQGILAAQPRNSEAMYWLGRAYKGLASETLDRLTGVAPASYRIDQLAGEIHEERTEYGKAVEAYRRALEKAPDVPGLRHAIGTAYWKMGSFEDAQEWLEQELERNPHHARARYRLGNLLLARGRPKEAIPHLLEAAATSPDLPEARFDLGRAYLEDQQYASAAEQLEACARLDPGNDRVHYLLGNAYRGLGRAEDAQKEYLTYQELSRQRLRKVQQDVRSVSEDVNPADP